MSSIQAMFDKLDSLHLKPLGGPERDCRATPESIEQLETLFGHKFPKAYAAFLMHYGRSSFQYYDEEADYHVKYPMRHDFMGEAYSGQAYSSAEGAPDVFYGSDPKGEDGYNLESEIEWRRRGVLPQHWLPIAAYSGLGNRYFLSLGEQDYGHLYSLEQETIWDMEEDEIEPSEVPNYAVHLADSFEHFVEALYAEKVED